MISLSGTCKYIRKYILDNLEIFTYRYNLDKCCTLHDLLTEYINIDIFNKIAFYAYYKHYDKLKLNITQYMKQITNCVYKKILYILYSRCSNVHIIIDVLNKDNKRTDTLEYMIYLCCELNRADILSKLNSKYNKDVRLYLIQLFNQHQYNTIHDIICINRRLIHHIRHRIINLVVTRNTQVLLELFQPVTCSLNTDKINTFINDVMRDNYNDDIKGQVLLLYI